MPVLVRALIHGFGWKFGFELGRFAARKLGIEPDAPAAKKSAGDAEEDPTPPEAGGPAA